MKTKLVSMQYANAKVQANLDKVYAYRDCAKLDKNILGDMLFINESIRIQKQKNRVLYGKTV